MKDPAVLRSNRRALILVILGVALSLILLIISLIFIGMPIVKGIRERRAAAKQ